MFSPNLLKGKVVYFKKGDIMCSCGVTSLSSFIRKSAVCYSFQFTSQSASVLQVRSVIIPFCYAAVYCTSVGRCTQKQVGASEVHVCCHGVHSIRYFSIMIGHPIKYTVFLAC